MKDDAPYNLIFRAEKDDDPRKRLLKDYGWFPVKKCEYVLSAAPTLEAFNTLEETDLEFDMSSKAKAWYGKVSYSGSWTDLFKEDCPLFDYQKDAVSFLWTRDRAMLSLSPGLGKTLTSAYAAGIRDKVLGDVKKILLVCPASLLHYWKGELAKWDEHLPRHPFTVVWHRQVGDVVDVVLEGEQLWVITNPETLVKNLAYFESVGFDLMIVDESIMYKHRESKRSIQLNSLAQTIKKVWLLTGAPATRYLDDMWHQFHILNNRGYPSYWRFAERYCKIEETVWAKTVIANARHGEKEIKENFADIYFARNQDQVANIPEWLFEDIDIEMTEKQSAAYSELQTELKVTLSEYDDSEVITVTNRLALMLRSLQVASNPVLLGGLDTSGKWEAVPELMDIYPGPFILWVNFIRTGEMMQERLQKRFGKDRVVLANGSTSMLDRTLMVNCFQDGQHDVIILNNTVGKFGFNLTKARTAIFLERDYNDSYFQCLFRHRRIGTTQAPVVLNLRSCTQRYSYRTIDHVVHDALDYRNNMIKKITVGDLRKLVNQ